jgi:hypothetical protein
MAAVINSFPASEIRMSGTLPPTFPAHDDGVMVMSEERLPFTVRLVRTEHELAKAVAVRHAAYARHLPEFAEQLRQPELSDFSDECAVLLAESRLDGSPLGTIRIHTNRRDPLPLEQSVELPDWLRHGNSAEAARLGVTEGMAGHLVKTVLFKAFYLYCLNSGIDWMVIAGRSPIDRQYQRLLFQDVFPGQGYVPLRHVSNLPHRIMCFDVATAEARWARAGHPLYKFMVQTQHPDLMLDQPGPGVGHIEPATQASSLGAVARLPQ